MIKDFKNWILERENFSKVEEAEVPWATEETKKLVESNMSEIHILAQEAPTFEKFVESFKAWTKKNNIELDKEYMDNLKTIYDNAKEDTKN